MCFNYPRRMFLILVTFISLHCGDLQKSEKVTILSHKVRNQILCSKHPIQTACKILDENHSEVFEGLCVLEDLEEKDQRGMTPFLSAVYRNKLTFLRILAELNADKNSKDNKSRNAIHLALLYLKRNPQSSIDTLKWLLEQNINLEDRNKSDHTPLLMATKRNLPQNIIQLLLDHGADINAALPLSQDTAAHLAAKRNNLENFRILVQAQASLLKENNESKTPLQQITREKRKFTETVIENNGSACQICYNNESVQLLNCCYKNLCQNCLHEVYNSDREIPGIRGSIILQRRKPQCPFCRVDNPTLTESS